MLKQISKRGSYWEERREREAKERAERFKRNLEVIQLAKNGSDIYGILEKAAFHIHLARPAEAELSNWLEANRAVAAYFSTSGCGGILDLDQERDKDYLKRRLRDIAGSKRREYEKWAKIFSREPTLSDDSYWNSALDSMGELISREFMTFFEGNLQKIFEAFHI